MLDVKQGLAHKARRRSVGVGRGMPIDMDHLVYGQQYMCSNSMCAMYTVWVWNSVHAGIKFLMFQEVRNGQTER